MKGMIMLTAAMLTAVMLPGEVSAAEKSIVVYFSHAGENYGVGNVTEGNTAKVAKILAAKTGSEIYEIQELKPYPTDYQKCVDLAKDEQRRKARPAIKGELPDLSGYQTIYLGYPNWWGDCPMIVYAFLEKCKLDGKVILVAEDEAMNVAYMQEVLAETRAKVLWARNGQEAVDVMKEHPEIDLILMDIKMPIMNGYDATVKIREFNKDVIIIAQTAYALTGEKEKTIAAGCNYYLTKPIEINVLLNTLSGFLKNK